MLHSWEEHFQVFEPRLSRPVPFILSLFQLISEYLVLAMRLALSPRHIL